MVENIRKPGVPYMGLLHINGFYLISALLQEILEGGGTAMITISETAVEKLKEAIAKQKNPKNTMLRIDYGGYG
jgi:hypothetical protein